MLVSGVEQSDSVVHTHTHIIYLSIYHLSSFLDSFPLQVITDNNIVNTVPCAIQ